MTASASEGPAGASVGRVGDRAALDRLLGPPEMAWFVDRVRGRILAAGGAPLSGVVQLNEPTAEQRAAAVRLLGRPRRTGAALRVDLAIVEQILRRGPWPAGLADAVEVLSGPVVDRSAEREREAAAWDAVREGLSGTIAQYPRLAAWWDAWCRSGALKRAARAEADRTSTTPSPAVAADLVDRLALLFENLPASGEPLAVLAGRVVGDAHGLDASRPLGRLAATAVGVAFLPDAEDRVGDPSVRDAWAAGGVVLSNVASTVLCLGVPGVSLAGAEVASPSARSATAASLEAMRAARMPLLLTLDQVRSGGIRELQAGSTVHVCENPTIVEVVAAHWARSIAVADERGVGSPVLVCTSGQPSTAVLELLQVLTAEGAECRYHGDFDWAGLRIAQSLGVSVPWTPWRYLAADYRAAVGEGKPSRHLAGIPAESPWDPTLAVAMAERGLALEEEVVADLLAADVLAG
jgi:uncharacterized protein (TIGR02679 family)